VALIKWYKKIVKFCNYGPNFFSLRSSPNKDSISRIVSEMVGIQNIRGSLVDNCVKQLASCLVKQKSQGFIDNYKDLMSRITGYFSRSGDMITSSVLSRIAYSSMVRMHGIDITESQDLPVDFGGIFRNNIKDLEKFGYMSDYVFKAIIMNETSRHNENVGDERKQISISKLLETTVSSMTDFTKFKVDIKKEIIKLSEKNEI